MRILLAADPLLPVPPRLYGGIERIVAQLAAGLREEGHAVGLAALGESTAPVDALFPWPCRDTARTPDTIRNALALARAAWVFQADVVHNFSRLAHLFPLLAAGRRALMSYQRHTGGPGVRAGALLGGSRLRFTGCSGFICTQGQRAGGHWTSIPNFIELSTYPFVPTVAADAPLVFLSRLDRIKGPELAIQIARRAGRRLILAGNIPTDPEGRAFWESCLAPEIGHDGIDYVGEVDDTQKAALLGSAAALLLPIQWDEPFGIVYAEALACGAPLLTCPRGAAPEIVRNGATGWLFETLEEGVQAVNRLGTLDRQACRRDAETRFSSTAVIAAYVSVYRELAGGA